MNKNIKVLHIITSLEQGGAERQLVELVKENNSHAVCQLCDGNFYKEELKNSNIKIFNLNFNRNFLDIFSLFKLYKFIKHFKPDIINTWMYHSCFLELLLRKLFFLSRIPLVWGLRCSNMDMANYSLLLRIVIKICKYFSDTPDLIINNSYSGLNYHKAIGYKGKNIVIHNGIDTKYFSFDSKSRKSFRDRYKIHEDSKVLLCVARYDQMKDHQILIESFREIKEKLSDTILVLAGKGTEKFKEKNGIIALGAVKNINYVYSGCDIIISCSAYGEGFSNALAEGMASELIPIATDVGDSATIIGKVGKIIMPRNKAQLIQAITEALQISKKASDNNKKLARKRIIENFSHLKMVDSYHKEYSKLLVGKK